MLTTHDGAFALNQPYNIKKGKGPDEAALWESLKYDGAKTNLATDDPDGAQGVILQPLQFTLVRTMHAEVGMVIGQPIVNVRPSGVDVDRKKRLFVIRGRTIHGQRVQVHWYPRTRTGTVMFLAADPAQDLPEPPPTVFDILCGEYDEDTIDQAVNQVGLGLGGLIQSAVSFQPVTGGPLVVKVSFWQSEHPLGGRDSHDTASLWVNRGALKLERKVGSYRACHEVPAFLMPYLFGPFTPATGKAD